jgi:autotransporter-associated beta strand protein
MKKLLTTIGLAAVTLAGAHAQTSFTDVNATGAWNTSRWNNTADTAPYNSAYTANNDVNFTSGNYSFAGMGATINVGNINVASGANVTFSSASNTFATGGNVRTITVASGSTLDFSNQSFSTAAGTGFIKNGDGVLALAGNTHTGGFTLNAGTVIARGVNAMGGGATNVLTLNGGTVASNGNRDFSGKYGGGIVIGGNVQFGELATNVALASNGAGLTFSDNVSLGSANRILTLGNNGNHVFSGVISGTGGITFAANSGVSGRFDITNTANTFTGDITITGGEVRFTADGSMGNAANDIYIDGGRFATTNNATFTLGAGRDIFIGDTAGTSISTPGNGTLTITTAIADITGKTGSWAKQGGGTLELGGASTYTGNTAINNGTFRLISGNDRLPTGTVVSLGQAGSNNLGTLDLNGHNQQIAGLQSTTGNNIGSNTNVVTSATAATLTINNSGNFVFSDGTPANSGVISGAISLVKEGTGTQTLGGVNTYTGGTTINGGTLLLTGAGTIGTGDLTMGGGTLVVTGITASTFTMASGTTLSGVGTINATGKTVQVNGTLSPGFSPGTLTINGDLTLGSSAVSNFEINGTTSGLFDSIVGVDTMTFGGTLNLTTGYAAALGDSVQLFSANSYSGTFSSINGTNLGGGLSWSFDAANGTITVIPEPSTWAMLVGGLGALILLRRRSPNVE